MVQEQIPSFVFLRTARYSCGGVTNTVKEYRHDQIGLEFVLIPGGTFMMGSPTSESDRESDEVQHQVTLSPYLICKTEVPQSAWERVMGSNPSYFKGTNLPVEQVSWDECMSFCQKTGLSLPTEAQWEFACRAGTQTPFNVGPNIMTDIVNYDGNYPYAGANEGQYRKTTVAVGSLLNANAYGLYDMHGNVCEWCSDWYGDYQTAQPIDPKGLEAESFRICRGGSWSNGARDCRSAYRYYVYPSNRSRLIGFRPLRAYPKSQVIDK